MPYSFIILIPRTRWGDSGHNDPAFPYAAIPYWSTCFRYIVSHWSSVSSWPDGVYKRIRRNPRLSFIDIPWHIVTTSDERWRFATNVDIPLRPLTPNPERRWSLTKSAVCWYPPLHCDRRKSGGLYYPYTLVRYGSQFIRFDDYVAPFLSQQCGYDVVVYTRSVKTLYDVYPIVPPLFCLFIYFVVKTLYK